ncbi:Gfo/Idh/MocA family oxidoreductase [Aestuariivirga sp.]|uniref:Gfo/Idh/MocA family oxidoreductase n=1 Tax=Aestuariivirga sp. TaxID=2650926 RepID=UPI003BAACAF0
MTISVGVVGLGVMGAEHARILQNEVRGAHLGGVYDLDIGRAAAPGVRVYADAVDLIRSPEIEAVVIASPDSTHAGLVLECLRAGKHVLCEKPIAGDQAEARSVIEAELKLGRRLIQVGYMRRFDPTYEEMRATRIAGTIGSPVILHNVHRNARAPEWFTGSMSVTNSFVHEIDISRWLLGSEMIATTAVSSKGGDPLLITMWTDREEIVSTEIFMNAAYGYHVHAELVGRFGTVAMTAPALTTENTQGRHGHSWAQNWVPRFAVAYRRQMQAWINSLYSSVPCGASAWDGYIASSIAAKIAEALPSKSTINLDFGATPELYRI